jgi:cell wall-associated NlpC family hydrolase
VKAYFDLHNGAFVAFRLTHLIDEAKSWVGTPFVAHSRVKGAGVDCVNLAAALYLETRVLDAFDPPAYALDGGVHNKTSQVVEWLENHPRFMAIYHKHGPMPYNPMVGDALVFKNVQSEHHVAVMLAGHYFIHSVFFRKVVIGSLTDPLYKHALSAVYRPMEPIDGGVAS